MVRLSISLLGTFQVLLYGVEIVGFDSDKVRALLAYLVIESDRPHRREALASLLWPERPERTARHNLSQALSNLRALLDDAAAGDHLGPALTADRQAIQFNAASDHWLDVAAFAAALNACEQHPHRRLDLCEPCIERLHRAMDLYRGSFLEGFSLGDSPSFDEWTLLQQERFHRQVVDALCRLARCHELRGDGKRALRCVRRHVQLEPWREDAHRQVMRLLAAAGQRNAALAQYQNCRQILEAELGVEPEEGTTALYHSIRDGGELPADTALPPHNLPAPYTPFVGREAELAEIGARLRDRNCRLLTLVGPGGSGKTRLALEAATDVLYAEQGCGFTHGVYFVSLAPLQSPEAIVPAVAQATGFAFRAGSDGRGQLLDYLRGKSMLLILDNVEHLLTQHRLGERSMDRDGEGVVTDILQAAPNVKILTTSRARLNVQGEYLLPIGGMRYPEIPPDALSEVGRHSAVQLFLTRARQMRPDFQPETDDLVHVVHICQLVEGRPLAILLAAAWMRMLAPAEIAAQIRQSLDFLTTDLHDVPDRHTSVRAVFDHSWNLLTTRERALMQALSVFRGGFARQAAQQVAGATLRELRALIDKSLLEWTPGPDGRYEMHELLRQYAAEKLGDVPAEEEVARNRHCAYYAGFLQQREVDLIGWNQKKALAEIGAEIENVRAGWDWAVAQGKVEEIDRSLGSLAEFYRLRARFQEGEEAFARAAQRLTGKESDVESRPEVGRKSTFVLSRVLLQQGRFCDALGLVEKGGGLLQESLAIFRDLGARREMAFALCYLGDVFRLQGEGKPLYSEGLAIFKEIGDRRGSAHALRGLGWVVTEQGEYRVAQQLLRESLAIFRELGDQEGTIKSLTALGYVTWVLGEYKAAKQLHQESLALCRDTGNQAGIAHSLEFLAQAVCGLAEYEKAKQLWHESLAIHKEIGNLRGVVGVLADLSEAAVALGEYEEAARLAQQSLALHKKLDDRFGMAWSLRVLANAACGLGDLQGARKYFSQALETATTVRWTSVTLLALVGVGALLATEGKKERALELLALILHHPLSWRWTKDRAAPLVAELEAELPPDVVAAAQERGRARDLEATVKELLAELAP
jgi:predicted ATPase/DNA-binding SARP family transcriptional activator